MKAFAAIGLGAVALAACTTMGMGTGEARNGSTTASFAWKSQGLGGNGTMTANLSDGQTYQGPYFQITRQTDVDTVGPLWSGWGGRGHWAGWGGWGPVDSFATEYTGKALANLHGPTGYMRCQFTLVRPTSGMAGGGIGRCQLPSGTIIDAEFPQA